MKCDFCKQPSNLPSTAINVILQLLKDRGWMVDLMLTCPRCKEIMANMPIDSKEVPGG